MTIAVAIARIVGLDQPFDLLPHQNLRPSLPYPEPSVFAYMAGGPDWPLLPGRSWYWWPTGLGLEQDVWLQQAPTRKRTIGNPPEPATGIRPVRRHAILHKGNGR